MNDKPSASSYLQGVPGAPGLASGPAFLWQKKQMIVPRLEGRDPAEEERRLREAIELASEQIRELSRELEADGHLDEAAVFDAHVMLVQDRSLNKRVQAALAKGVNAEAGWSDAVEKFAGQLDALPDETLRLRAADLRDVGRRVLGILLGESTETVALDRPSIVLADDLTPSETAGVDKKMVLAFCTAEGGPTSHTAILAKALGIPAVVGLGEDILKVATGTPLLIDGAAGNVIVAPGDEDRQIFAVRSRDAQERSNAELAEAGAPAVTRDGIQLEVVANIGNLDDARSALHYGAEGVGLFRTEFLFLDRTSAPGEEEQYGAYRQVMEAMEGRPVVVRTIDAGGDKELTYLNTFKEANPFLGWRAIRLCLDQPDWFKQQLRALVRAGAGCDLRIMFPMVATLDEVRRAKALLAEAIQEVQSQGLPFAETIQIGIMIEIPSAALLADRLSEEVDFFSIGTNDLTQYTLAADRTNQKVANLNDHCHPAVLRLIERVTEAAAAAGIWVGVCGEMAGDIEAIPLLVGLGIDELSMSPTLIPGAKSLIRRLSRTGAAAMTREALGCASAEEVRAMTRRLID